MFSKDIYEDYDILNKLLEEEFKVKIAGEVKNFNAELYVDKILLAL